MTYNHKQVTEQDVESAYIDYLETKSSPDFPGTDEQHREACRKAYQKMQTLANQLEAQRTSSNSDR